MQMAIVPTHGILNGDVQVPERVRGRNQDSAPDYWDDSDERDPYLQGLFGCHSAASVVTLMCFDASLTTLYP